MRKLTLIVRFVIFKFYDISFNYAPWSKLSDVCIRDLKNIKSNNLSSSKVECKVVNTNLILEFSYNLYLHKERVISMKKIEVCRKKVRVNSFDCLMLTYFPSIVMFSYFPNPNVLSCLSSFLFPFDWRDNFDVFSCLSSFSFMLECMCFPLYTAKTV